MWHLLLLCSSILPIQSICTWFNIGEHWWETFIWISNCTCSYFSQNYRVDIFYILEFLFREQHNASFYFLIMRLQLLFRLTRRPKCFIRMQVRAMNNLMSLWLLLKCCVLWLNLCVVRTWHLEEVGWNL